MNTSDKHDGNSVDNVYDLFSGQTLSSQAAASQHIIRLAPELDGLEMLYSNNANPNKLFAMRILCWALCEDGTTVGIIPWMDGIVPCSEIEDPLEGKFEGYYDAGIDEVFFEAPIHKIIELETAAEYYEIESDDPNDIIQDIPDTIGTHAVFNTKEPHSLLLTEVISWQLRNDGTIHGMVVDDKKCVETPVLPGDDCLCSALDGEHFRYYFQHHIANKIKAKDPDALAAVALLVEKEERVEKESPIEAE